MRLEDRLIVITDEQSQDEVPTPVVRRAYVINVASNRNGVSYSDGWRHVDGFSEAVLHWIREVEADEDRHEGAGPAEPLLSAPLAGDE